MTICTSGQRSSVNRFAKSEDGSAIAKRIADPIMVRPLVAEHQAHLHRPPDEQCVSIQLLAAGVWCSEGFGFAPQQLTGAPADRCVLDPEPPEHFRNNPAVE